ncbi:MAG: hypothetical protein NC132_01460 [Corallococcus sp.]|nr:hypothetical protein [Corallococcus sp.]MCM1359325.1 hypothetical protein [Corallococcus sp.]MCM1394768.1 hypothetical protein [Corallococcus sp.]
MLRRIKRYLAVSYLYYSIPFLICVVYIACVLTYSTLQLLINSIYANFFNLLIVACAVIAIPNFARLIYYSKRTLDLPEDISVSAATTEDFGGAGEGKTSSAVLKGVFEAEKLQHETEMTYNYMCSNYKRWKKKSSWKLKNFNRIEQSVKFWREHPELIPYLASTVEIKLPNGQKSLLVTREHVEQLKWLPICFFVADEAGLLAPQDEYKDRSEAVVLFFRFVRHFGFRGILCEQKKDGILINVRSVLGGTSLCLGQRNALLPYFLIDVIAFLKRILPKVKNSPRLGHVIEKLQNFSSCIGFRIWDKLYFKTMEFVQYKPPEQISFVCTNKMPCSYDDTAFSELYLAKDKPSEVVLIGEEGITLDSEYGQLLTKRIREQDEQRKAAELDRETDLIKSQIKNVKAKKEMEQLNADKE